VGFDVVVVGGGIGGLAVASLVAQAGRKVLLLEETAQLGGACLAVTHDGHRYDLGVSLITGAASGGRVASLCDRVGINLPIVPCDPAVQIALPRHRISLAAGIEGWWPELHREFPKDEEAWHALITDMASLARGREELAQHLPALPPAGWRERFRCWRILALRQWLGAARPVTQELRKAAGTPFRQALDDYGLGSASRLTLEACLWYLLLRGAEECSTLEAALAIQRLREGVVVFPDGPAALADQLAQRLQERGGEIRLSTPAARCITERGRVVGVTTKTGETFRARWVVTDVPPGCLMNGFLPTARGLLRRRSLPGTWQPRCIAQVMGVAIPEAVVPSELGWHCFIVADVARPARDENLVFVRRTPTGPEVAADGIACFSVGRFVPASAPQGEQVVIPALMQALDHVIPGAADLVVHRRLLPSASLGELWGRPMAAGRYEMDSRAWLGRRGLAHDLGWPGLLAVGEWTYPGRLLSDVVEGAMHVADGIVKAGEPRGECGGESP
jgi:phytoene dehydrogenase-like protein